MSKKAFTISWNEIEEQYTTLFPSKKGMPAKPLQTALGSLLVEFRKRLTDEVLAEINEMIIEYNHPSDPPSGGPCRDDKESTVPPAPKEDTNPQNQGMLILDATCAPQNITYPQDVNLLNEARENLEHIIDTLCHEFNYYKPRIYRKNARRNYLNLAKTKKRTSRRICKAIKQQLQYIRRDLGYIEGFLGTEDVILTKKQESRLKVIRTLVGQQQYIYDNKVHSVPDRIVSISQPYIRPIVR